MLYILELNDQYSVQCLDNTRRLERGCSQRRLPLAQLNTDKKSFVNTKNVTFNFIHIFPTKMFVGKSLPRFAVF